MRDFSKLQITDKKELLKYLLSPKEFHTVMLMLDGKKNAEIAEELQVRIKTVKHHLTNAYRILSADGWRDIYKWYHGKIVVPYSIRRPKIKNPIHLITDQDFIEKSLKVKHFSQMSFQLRKWVKLFGKQELRDKCFPNYKEYEVTAYKNNNLISQGVRMKSTKNNIPQILELGAKGKTIYKISKIVGVPRAYVEYVLKEYNVGNLTSIKRDLSELSDREPEIKQPRAQQTVQPLDLPKGA